MFLQKLPSVLGEPVLPYRDAAWPHCNDERKLQLEKLHALAQDYVSGDLSLELACQCMSNARFEEAAKWLYQGAKCGDRDCMAILGAFYIRGAGVQVDEKVGLAWIEASGNIVSDFLREDPRRFAKEAGGKQLVEVEVVREYEDTQDVSNFRFFGRPKDGPFSIPIHPDDVEGQCKWSFPKFIEYENVLKPGFYQQKTVVQVWFDMPAYEISTQKQKPSVKSRIRDDFRS